METSKITLKAALHHWAAESGQTPGEHPSLETLVAYQEDELSDPQAIERLQDHLVLCADCAAQLLDLADFESPESPAEVSDGDVEAAWARLRPKVGMTEMLPVPVLVADNVRRMSPAPSVRLLPQPAATSGRSPWRSWPLAASYILVAGLSLWVVNLRQENQELRKPFVAGSSLTLAAEATRGESPVQSFPGSQGLLVDLTFPGQPAGVHRVEIVADAEPGRVVAHVDVNYSPERQATIALRPGSLKPGLYRIRLYVDSGPPVEHRIELTAH